MQLRAEQLTSHLSKQLLPIYLLSGDEPLQLMEAADGVRQKARAEGFAEREILDVDRSFDWGQLFSASNSMSLFASRRIIELRLPTAKPGREGSLALLEYCQNPDPDNLLLIIAGKLDAAAKKSKWCKTLESAGVLLQVWMPDTQQLPQWIQQRMIAQGLAPDQGAVQVVANRVEGNLLAASQEIEKLSLLFHGEAIDAEKVATVVADSTRYSTYDLADALLKGDARRAVRIFHGLLSEGVVAPLFLSVITRDLRVLYGLANLRQSGGSEEQVFKAARIWNNKQGLYRTAIGRISLQQV
ncbi:MAG: DNA polymerase III subunit delta, partial [Gammaproteobacteria bacterium]|nr:DNA polymerase III subunit delta [Gammaproteobacteria bacterium]